MLQLFTITTLQLAMHFCSQTGVTIILSMATGYKFVTYRKNKPKLSTIILNVPLKGPNY